MDKKRTCDDLVHEGNADRAHGDVTERSLQKRETSVRVREDAADARESAADSRESAADSREIELSAREDVARLREEALRARAEADEIRADRERLLVQMREANEKLVVATVHADELAEAAADNEERFRSLIAASSAVVWHADARGVVHIDSESWRAFTGMETPDDEAGWLQAIHADDREHVRDAWRRSIETTMPYVRQHRLQRHDGSYVWVVARAVPIVRSGVVREWIGMMTDVTDRVRVEEARDQFIGILGHDLRNPLAAISIGAELLAEVPARYSNIVARISRSAQRMEVIVRDVMDFARGRLSGGIPVVLASCDLGEIGREVVSEMKQAHQARDIELETVGDLGAECDTDRIEQVLSNLVGNAITHGADPIRVTIAGEAEEVVISVRNQGPPIPAGLLPRLFEPFARGVRETRARDGSEGLGLGLYIASEIVRAHGGTIAVSSRAGAGTTFAIRWPRSAAARARLVARSD